MVLDRRNIMVGCICKFCMAKSICEERDASENYKINKSCPQWDLNMYTTFRSGVLRATFCQI